MENLFHLNPANGVVNRCRAEKGKCPFGGAESHYGSIAEARRGYEQAMAHETLPSATSKKPSLKELNQWVKTTDDPSVIAQGLERGSQQTYSNLLKNPHLTGDNLVELRGKLTHEGRIRDALQNPSYPVAAMSADDFAMALSGEPWDRNDERLWSSDELTDAHLEGLAKVDTRAIANPRNGLSAAFRATVAEQTHRGLAEALRSGSYPLAERAATMPLDKLKSVGSQMALASSTDSAGIEALATRAASEGNTWVLSQVSRNPHLTSATIDVLAASYLEGEVKHSEDVDAGCGLIRHDATSAETRRKLMEHHPALASYGKVFALNDAAGGELAQAMGFQGEMGSGGRSQRRALKFDPAKVKALGMDSSDVDTFVRRIQGNWLFSPSYNESSGVYEGFID